MRTAFENLVVYGILSFIYSKKKILCGSDRFVFRICDYRDFLLASKREIRMEMEQCVTGF